MENDKIQCPCKRIQCERHGNCSACMQHHHSPNKKLLPACERIAAKTAKLKKTEKTPAQQNGSPRKRER